MSFKIQRIFLGILILTTSLQLLAADGDTLKLLLNPIKKSPDGWEVYFSGDNREYYLKPSSLVVEGNERRIWTLEHLKDNEKESFTVSAVRLALINCKNKSFKYLQTNIYSAPRGTGRLVKVINNTGSEVYIEPGRYSIVSSVCYMGP